MNGGDTESPRLASHREEGIPHGVAALRCEAGAFEPIEDGAGFPVPGAGTRGQRRRSGVRPRGSIGRDAGGWAFLFGGSTGDQQRRACRDGRTAQRAVSERRCARCRAQKPR
jgi:hypothetical protein